MHIRYPRAAVAVDEQQHPNDPQDAQRPVSRAARGRGYKVLWASRSLGVRGGRLVGIRLRGQGVEVGLVKPDGASLRWVPAESVLTAAQVAHWLHMAKFAP